MALGNRYNAPMPRRFEFSLRALLSGLAAIAVLLALMFQSTPEVGTATLVVLVPLALALAVTGLVYGHETARPFCIGASIPLAMTSVYMMAISGRLGAYALFFGADMRRYYGGAQLAAIGAGYLCVLFRWIIEPPK